MATLTTKYSIGDIVWRAGTTTERKQHPCPDCLGSRKWKATSPAGSEYEFRCPRCAASYTSNHDVSLWYTASTPYVQQLTIGSVQYNTAIGSYDSGARYMCLETGVGSGSVYNESDLHETEEAAMLAATAQASVNNSTIQSIVKLYNHTLEISDYELESALLKLAKDEQARARQMLWGMGDLFGRIEEADSKEDILETVDDYKRYDWDRNKKTASELAPDLMDMHDKTIAMVKTVVGID
jgi:hypothetical protein